MFSTGPKPTLPNSGSYFHLHLISDATGETLIAASRAVTSQYKARQALEHVYPLIRSQKQLESVIEAIDREPGIVLYTITDTTLGSFLEDSCRQMGIPVVSVLEPILQVFHSYLGAPSARKVGAQHELNSEYFGRIDALNFTMMHDDGALPEDIDEADIVLVGISRTSKTPTSIYLANRGIKTANVPLVPGVEPPPALLAAKRPLVVALIASADRISQVRQNRVLGLQAHSPSPEYARSFLHRRGTCPHAPPLRASGLADDRCFAQVDRGNGGRDRRPAHPASRQRPTAGI